MGRSCAYSKISILFFSVILLFTASTLHAAENYEVYVAKGIQNINEGNYNDAVEMLEKAAGLAPEDPEVIYYSAVAYSRAGDYQRAEDLFLSILQDDPSSANVYLELGRIYYINDECIKADEYLAQLVSMVDDEALKSYASSMLDDCGEKKTATEEGMFNVTLTLGGQHDNNVILEADNPIAVTKDRKADSRFLAYLSTRAKLFENDRIKLNADYNIYHSMHKSLNDFNVHYHKISPYIEILNMPKMYKPTVGYSFEYTMFGGQHYSSIHSFFADLVIKEGDGLATELSYKFSDNEFYDSHLFLTNSLREGDTSSLGVAQRFAINDVSVKAFYSKDFVETSASYWDYDSDSIGAECSYTFTSPVKMNLKLSAEHGINRYKGDYPGQAFSRMDKLDQFDVMLTYLGYKKGAITLMNSYSINESNLSPFDYKRNIIGMFFTMRLL